jgi:2-oxoisovalerate dehydrogenase E1 component
VPWDIDAVQDAVQATGKVIIVHEDTLRGGIGGEIAAWIGEHCFRYLDAPVVRVGSLDTPVPFNADLEANFLGKSRLKEKVIELIDY